MIDVYCTCGAHYQVLNEQVAARTRCQKCGTPAADVLGQSSEATEAEPSAEPAAEPAAEPVESAEPQFQIPCCNHPDQLATQNCMNCAKPLCMDCVRERGYYCSDECKQSVEAAEPDATAADSAELDAVAEQVGHSMQLLGVWAKRLAKVAALVAVGWIGWMVYEWVTAPKGQVTAKLGVMTGVDNFEARMIGPDLVVVQSDDGLSLMKLSTQAKLWTASLSALEEKVEPPPRKNISPEMAVFLPREYHDPLQFADVQGDNVIVHSGRQIIDFDLKTGAVKWKFFDPTISIESAMVHEGGVWCSIAPNWSSKSQGKTWFADYSLADGAPAWSYTNQGEYVVEMVCASDRVALLFQAPRTNAAASRMDEDLPTNAKGEVTAGPAEKFSLQKLLAQAKGETETGPASDFTVRFFALADGHTIGQTNLSLSGRPQLEQIGSHLCLVSGKDLTAFDNGASPAWQVTLPSQIESIGGGGSLILAATSEGLTAINAGSGQQKWTRKDLPARGPMAIGPDGSVYVTIALPKEKEQVTEAKNFRNAEIAAVGSRIPGEPITTLLKLDPQTGKTRWGVKNIGRHLLFSTTGVYVFDAIQQINLLANQMAVGTFSVQVLSPRNGKEMWAFRKASDLCRFQMLSNQVFLVTDDDAAFGREHPTRNYQLQLVEAK